MHYMHVQLTNKAEAAEAAVRQRCGSSATPTASRNTASDSSSVTQNANYKNRGRSEAALRSPSPATKWSETVLTCTPA